MTPFFSIGVTTYNRRELLKQALRSIIGQTFSHFEVIVGNDYTEETLFSELLDIEDPRIRFVNHPRNLGEVGNMNSLLRMARGQYFTWLADDDMYAPDFLKVLHAAVVKFNFPPCAFTSSRVIHGTSFPAAAKNAGGQEQLLPGRQFLRMYLGGKLKVIGTYGVFETETIRRMGGVERLCDAPMGPYGEYMLLIRCGLLKNVAYVDAPLVFYCSHEQAWGISNTEVDLYKIAGENLVGKGIEVLRTPELKEDLHHNLFPILKLVLENVVVRTQTRDNSVHVRQVIAYLFCIKRQIDQLKGSVLYWTALASLSRVVVWLAWPVVQLKLKSLAPPGLKKFIRTVCAFWAKRHE